MDIPIRAFWLMNRNVQRVAAEFDQRALVVAISSQSGDGVRDLRERLNEEMGEVVTGSSAAVSDVRDEHALAALKLDLIMGVA